MTHNTSLQPPALKGWFESSGRLYQQRIRDLSLLRRLGDAISCELELADATDTILEILVDELDITNASIMLISPCSNKLSLQSARSEDPDIIPANPERESPEIRVAEGIGNTVIETRQPILIQDAGSDARVAGQAVRLGSLLCLPLIVRDRTIGVLNLSHSRRAAFGQGDLNGLTIVANQIAMLLENAEHYQKIRDINLDLEYKVRERTAHLEAANRELQETRNSLLQSERMSALGQMASGVAHDFNNTLAGIIGNTQLLLEEVKNEEVTSRLRAVELAARDGAATVKRIQEFSRVNRDTEFVPLDLNALIQETVTMTAPLWKDQVQRRGITVDLETHLGELPAVMGNASELREVLTNMIINALDAMPEGGSLVIRTSVAEDRVLLTVADNGAGVPAELLDRLFDPFFTTKGPNNSGLGLSVAYGIIRRHGGKISVCSEAGQGTRFNIELRPSKDKVPETPHSEPVRQTSPARILLVDDDPFVRDVLVSMLQHAGHEVVAFECGQKALAQFNEESFPLVLTDLGMPGMSGWDVAAAIRQQCPLTRVIMITGWGRELDITEAKSRGVDYVLPKPFELSTVTNMVAEALESRSAA
ncbi:MAG: ATP-binding protein [Pseudomonadota bacterium]